MNPKPFTSLRALAIGLCLVAGVVTATRSLAWEIRGPVKATVSVTNNNPLDVDVFVTLGDARIRLGTVVASQTQAFDLPDQGLTGPVRIVADPVGTREAYVSDPLTVSNGDRIHVTVANPLARSSVRIERGSRE